MHEKWMERTWEFGMPAGRLWCVLERLRGTAARMEEKVRGVSREKLTTRRGEAWTAQEHIGHLLDLEDLHVRRLEELERCEATLSAADMGNERTWQAKHNAKEAGELIDAFRTERARFVRKIERWDEGRMDVSAMHPRLKVKMRVIDVAWFTAEHDDYHLARVEELLRG